MDSLPLQPPGKPEVKYTENQSISFFQIECHGVKKKKKKKTVQPIGSCSLDPRSQPAVYLETAHSVPSPLVFQKQQRLSTCPPSPCRGAGGWLTSENILHPKFSKAASLLPGQTTAVHRGPELDLGYALGAWRPAKSSLLRNTVTPPATLGTSPPQQMPPHLRSTA